MIFRFNLFSEVKLCR